MTREEFIKAAYLEATRKDVPPPVGSRKYNALLEIGNLFIQAWQNEPNTDWNSLWRKEKIGTVSTTDRYSIDTDEVRKVSTRPNDKVEIRTADGQVALFSIVKPEQLSDYDRTCAKVGDELVFNQPFDSDSPLIGGDIYLPYFTYAERMTSSTSVVPVDQPMWLVWITAADFVRTDPAKPHLYGNLVAMAQDAMNSMKDNNRQTQSSQMVNNWAPLGMEW